MEKNTILAVVLSTAVLIGFFFFQTALMPPQSVAQGGSGSGAGGGAQSTEVATPALPVDGGGGSLSEPVADVTGAAIVENEDVTLQSIVIETNLLIVTLTNAGGDITSFRLKEHKDGAEYVDMLFDGEGSRAFTIALGSWKTAPIDALFKVKRSSGNVVEFSRNFSQGGKIFTLKKKYTFVENEYMFELDVSVESPAGTALGDGAVAYTLGTGAQIGPKFEKYDEQQNYRRFYTYSGGKLRQEKVGQNAAAENSANFAWTSLVGKYFALAAIPPSSGYTAVFSNSTAGNSAAGAPPLASRLFLERPALRSSFVEDAYYFYLGPKTSDALAIYDNAKNAWKFNTLEISKISATSGFWSILNPLEWLLKQILTFFNNLVHNYGVAIILLTVLVKVALFPLTKKSSEGTLRMQSISPKIKELQTKYKDNPQKLNMEMAALYKKEGYNPLSGCLPMLLQMPIFFAMYNLFNNHFDLRGALFIPGWIPDLSLPESIYDFGFRLPILGWEALRLLPFLYAGSQLIYGKVTQTPDSAGNAQMKIFLYVMPIMFFFILYNVPSGLLVYWIMSNLLTMVQQMALNKYMKKKIEAQAAIEPPKLVIAKKKKKR